MFPPIRIRRVLEVAAVALVLVVTLASTSIETASQPSSIVPWIDTDDRAAVVGAYSAEFSTDAPSIEWDGDHDSCNPGDSSSSARERTVQRINFYRAMAGVSATVVADSDYNRGAQAAALMMSAEGRLTHSPTATFTCFSAMGKEAAANSNLYLGRNGPSAIDGYIEDPGEDNIDVGHRNTILHPPTRRMGVGEIAGSSGGHAANALWVFDDRVFDESPTSDELAPMREDGRVIAWPPRGYVPADLIHPRWSYAKAGVDVSAAEVELYRVEASGALTPIPVEVVNRSGAPGHVPLPTLVWETTIGGTPSVDTDYVVVISGLSSTMADLPVAALAFDPDDPVRPEPMPSVDTYTVRVLGRDAGSSLTTAEFLTSLG